MDEDLSLLAEFCLIVKEKNPNTGQYAELIKIGLGFSVLPLFAAQIPTTSVLMQGTPRLLLS
jgi:hypothetical protein